MLFLGLNWSVAQEDYNDCVNALELCPNEVYSVNNIGANVTFCPGCDDDFNFCFATTNTIWFSFTTNNVGGDVQVDLANLVFQISPGQDTHLQATIIEAITPCSAGSYTALGNCESTQPGNFSLNVIGLAANTTYYVVVDGDDTGVGITSPAECAFDISIAGTGVDRLSSDVLLSQSSTSICKDEMVIFIASLQDCPDSIEYQWYINGELVAITSDEIFFTSELNDGDIVTVTNTCYAQCPVVVSTTSPPISVYSFPIDAGPDVSVMPGDVVSINGVTTAPVYTWTPSYLFSDPNSLATLAFPEETIIITLTATENGCTLSDQLTISISSVLVIPNTFSPNGDNINELWEIQGIELYPNNLMTIYDRWGQEVYKASGYSVAKAWDGTTKGKSPVSESVYYYVLDLRDGESEIVKGSITVLR
ncbi:MAG: gliding motility-associated C-terminal domain-containing protein [Crocinitomicaceae bacterium]|nr:gliding motility-associated C-terminal domain-containing protein [Crocinitomicaceae bacterium]